MPKYETIKNHVERRTYIQGKFKGKFIGYFDPRKSDVKHENFYDLEVISGEIVTTKNEFNVRHWETGEPEAFQEINNFLTKLPDNLPLEITDEKGASKIYNVNLNDKKLSDYTLSNQVYEGNKVFGDITGNISGYLKHYDTEYIEVEIEKDIPTKLSLPSDKVKTNKQTGNSEVDGNYKRWEYYNSDKSTYWGSWVKQSSTSCSSFSFWETMGLLLQIIIGAVFIIPLLIFGWKVILPIAILLGVIYLLSLLSSVIVSIFKWIFRFAGIALLLLMVFGIISAITNTLKYPNIKKTNIVDDAKEITEIEENPILGDSIITHHRVWEDYTNNLYEADIKMRVSDYKDAYQLRNNLSIPLNSTSQYNRIVSTIYDYDVNKLDLVYSTLDSLKAEKNLNKIEFAVVVVSLIQDIPYSLILGDACNANIYNDTFIKEYLAKNGDCQGFTKYGLLTPVEFMSTLQGDCDTRTLLLFTIFNHYNYDVVMLSSELYKHSIIGINLPFKGISKSINGIKYVVWETTTQGIPPGIISREISDMRFWNVSLISNKNLTI
ncbi:hypothetical protein [Zobellia galactanivorans]|uniref:Conserved hypothetical membrane protein n=1 Tax=Zobellia galactanivorans (strain DSM 12802 / CCUG 47099 / CIP 106680 / NCIMB 13871 / Dsij) TaxID=63186 RepID=G0L695_ZOBGA|nr:hypothetical protein [Zobellia galactanivorans]CAZ96794.1 Conserved hypothetical membrane protein [Zobellia galactanivorans]